MGCSSVQDSECHLCTSRVMNTERIRFQEGPRLVKDLEAQEGQGAGSRERHSTAPACCTGLSACLLHHLLLMEHSVEVG